MNSEPPREEIRTAQRVRQVLLELARREDDLAASVTAVVPWRAYPAAVEGHCAAASALRSEAVSPGARAENGSESLCSHPEVRYLRNAVGATIADGSCVLDPDHELGSVRLSLGPTALGPESAYWDGTFSVTRTPSAPSNPLRGKVLKRGTSPRHRQSVCSTGR